MHPGTRGRRLALWVLAGYAVLLVLVLTTPMSPGRMVGGSVRFLQQELGWEFARHGWVEFGANILLFMPLGLFVALISIRLWHAVALALALSAGAEVIQSFLPDRVTSLRDIVGNVLGALLGVIAARLVRPPGPAKGARTGRR